MRLIYAILIISTLTGCYDHRPLSDTMASYEFRETASPIPRAFDQRRHHVGRLATAEELAGTVPGPYNAYLPGRDVIQVAADGCYLSTLEHERQHMTDWHNGIRDREELEHRAMMRETKCLMDQGYSDAQIRTLNSNNAKVSDETLAEVRGMK